MLSSLCYCLTRFEVGIRVEGYAVGEERRHINSAFYIFRVTEEDMALPKLIADTEVSYLDKKLDE